MSALRATKRLGPWLVFGVVYADIGTSVFYVPGILHGSIGELASLAQILTIAVFVSIARKYVEICARCPDGGGVVSISEQAFPGLPTIALVGGAMITVNYFLTSAISGASGLYYLRTLIEFPKPLVVPITIACLGGLIVLNVIGLRESATVAFAMGVLQIAVNVALVILASAIIAERDAWGALIDHVFRPEVKLTATSLLVGYANTWLAYSGLESGAQLSGAMGAPVRRTASIAMWGVIFSIAVLSPTLTGFSTYLLDERTKVEEPESFIAQLALVVGERGGLHVLTVISATLLLIMACNTALVGNYHVNGRLTSAGFLPPVLATRNRRFGTPHVSILISGLVPMLVLVFTDGKVGALGDLYAFGLLGTLTISSIAVDVLRWREHGNPFQFMGGSITTMALLLAWLINLVHKPQATLFGGGLTLLLVGLGIAYRSGWIPRVAPPAPLPTWSAAEEVAGERPEAAKVLTLAEAKALKPFESSSVLVALRGLNEHLLSEAALIAKGLEERTVYVIVVDEVPGLFMPQEVVPSEDARDILARALEHLDGRSGLLGIPIWRIGSSASSAIAEAAEELGVKYVLVGTTKRSAIWHFLRGNVLKGLVKELSPGTQLLISS